MRSLYAVICGSQILDRTLAGASLHQHRHALPTARVQT
jgi:hypothetical protein